VRVTTTRRVNVSRGGIRGGSMEDAEEEEESIYMGEGD